MSMIEDIENALEYRVAKQYVGEFADEVIRDHHDAMNCIDCEEWLQKGIMAEEWITRADQSIREASYAGIIQLTNEVKKAIELLYRAWLAPCDHAEQWINRVLETGHRPENLDRFLECKAIITETIQRQDWQKANQRSRQRSFVEETW